MNRSFLHRWQASRLEHQWSNGKTSAKFQSVMSQTLSHKSVAYHLHYCLRQTISCMIHQVYANELDLVDKIITSNFHFSMGRNLSSDVQTLISTDVGVFQWVLEAIFFWVFFSLKESRKYHTECVNVITIAYVRIFATLTSPFWHRGSG